MGMKIYTNDLVKGHSDFKVKCLTFGLYTQVSDSGPLGPLVLETIVALGLKVAWKIQLNEFMKLSECQRSRPFFDLGQRLLRFQC